MPWIPEETGRVQVLTLVGQEHLPAQAIEAL
jgi:hypothetical protein